MGHLCIWMNMCQHHNGKKKKKALFVLFLPGPVHLVGIPFQVRSLVHELKQFFKNY